MTLSYLSFVVFLDPYQGNDGICLLSYPTLIRLLISGAHRWEIKYTYLQDIYCIVKPWIQRNKSMNGVW